MKILLTGGNGQLGRALQEALHAHQVTALDHQQLDIAQLQAVREAVQRCHPDVILNAAAYNNVDGAESDPQAAYNGNALGPRNLAVATAEQNIPLLHVSTDYVFDGTSKRPYHEFDRPRPCSIYGASKLAGEEAVRTLNFRHYVVRTAWLYHTLGRNFPKTMQALAAEKPEVRVVSDRFGSPTYAPHLAAAITFLITTGAYGTYHLAGRGGTSWYEFTRVLFQTVKLLVPVIPIATADFPRAAERPRYAVLTTLQDPLILLPPWQDGVQEYVNTLNT